jgi:hypothetical protein
LTITDDLPPNWREKVIEVLTQEGITHVPSMEEDRKLYLKLGYKVMQIISTLLSSFVRIVIPWHRFFPRFFVEARVAGVERHAIKALAHAKRPPALFLRSFGFDGLIGNIPAEQDLVLCVGGILEAPVIALGRPDEHAPPAGTAAVRFYVAHELWQQTVSDLVPLCSLVVWTVGITPNLGWEIRHLVEHTRPDRLVLWLHRDVDRARLKERADGFIEMEWNLFIELFGKVFPKPLPQLAAGEFIAFDAAWDPIIIRGGFPFVVNLARHMRGLFG